MNSRIIIIEGLQGGGKTSLSQILKKKIGASNLYQLSGTSDTTKTGIQKSKKMYYALLEYLKQLENCSINLIFDRIFITEYVYTKIGYKDYDFEEDYNILLNQLYNLDFKIDLILLTIQSKYELQLRTNREFKADLSRKNLLINEYNIEESIKQQNEYIKTFNKMPSKENVNIHIIDNTKSVILDDNFIKNKFLKNS